MNRNRLRLMAITLAAAVVMPVSAGEYDVVIGKNKDWLFTGYEFVKPADEKDNQVTYANLIQAAKLFRENGTAMAVMLVPSKIRIYADQLPADRQLDSYNDKHYAAAVKALRAGGVNVIDLNTPYLAMADRYEDNQLYFRLDTHWTAKGAHVAAETIKSTVLATPELKAAWQAAPEVKYELTWATRKRPTRARDLVHYLPVGTADFPPESVLTFKVARTQAAATGLTGAGETVGVTVIGSSYTDPKTGYPDAVRYTLQRDVLDISLPVDQGPWSGMLAYLGNEFKTSKPKLVIWEIPERELRSPPAAKWREARYQIDNAQWLSQMRELLKK